MKVALLALFSVVVTYYTPSYQESNDLDYYDALYDEPMDELDYYEDQRIASYSAGRSAEFKIMEMCDACMNRCSADKRCQKRCSQSNECKQATRNAATCAKLKDGLERGRCREKLFGHQ
jgi:hypothetical protein